MRKILQAAVAVFALTVWTVPAVAQPGSHDNKPQPSPILQEGNVSPIGIPAPTPAYGIKFGPCTVSVSCSDGSVIGCGGQNRCTWKLEPGGFVECDGTRINCPLA